jgi:DNA-binding IclR family transcriptional regulator
MRNTGVQTVDRALQLLLAFDEPGRQLGVTELAARLGVHKSTTSRLAATLAGRGFLERAPGSEAFRLGPELARLGRLAAADRDLVDVSRPAMAWLASETGETVNLAVLEGQEVVNVAQAEGRHIVGVGAWAGRRTPPHCAANGKVLLAFTGVRPEALPALTGRTITRPAVLERQLALVRCRGFATNVGELEEGLNAVAVPVVDAAGDCVAALSVSAPAYRLPASALEQVAGTARLAAGRIAAALGRSARAA